MMRRIDRKKFQDRIVGYDLSCPFCTDKIEMFCSGRCPACGNIGRIDPQPRDDLEKIAEGLRCALT